MPAKMHQPDLTKPESASTEAAEPKNEPESRRAGRDFFPSDTGLGAQWCLYWTQSTAKNWPREVFKIRRPCRSARENTWCDTVKSKTSTTQTQTAQTQFHAGTSSILLGNYQVLFYSFQL